MLLKLSDTLTVIKTDIINNVNTIHQVDNLIQIPIC